MNKLIIDNRTDLTDFDALILVKDVVMKGRVSNKKKQYSYLTVFNIDGCEYSVSTNLNKKSDRFIISKK